MPRPIAMSVYSEVFMGEASEERTIPKAETAWPASLNVRVSEPATVDQMSFRATHSLCPYLRRKACMVSQVPPEHLLGVSSMYAPEATSLSGPDPRWNWRPGKTSQSLLRLALLPLECRRCKTTKCWTRHELDAEDNDWPTVRTSL